MSLSIILHKQADLRLLWNKFFVDAPKKTLLWIEGCWHIVLINLYQYSENTFCWGQLTVECWFSSSVFQALSHKKAAFQVMCQLGEHVKTVENSNWHCDKKQDLRLVLSLSCSKWCNLNALCFLFPDLLPSNYWFTVTVVHPLKVWTNVWVQMQVWTGFMRTIPTVLTQSMLT